MERFGRYEVKTPMIGVLSYVLRDCRHLAEEHFLNPLVDNLAHALVLSHQTSHRRTGQLEKSIRGSNCSRSAAFAKHKKAFSF